MKFKENGNSDFLFGITLTELILMLFFLLLLVSAFMSAEKSSIITKVEHENERIIKENLDLKLKNKVSRTLSEQMIGSLLRFRLGEDKEQEKAKQIFKELSNQTKLIAENEKLKSKVEAYEVNEKLLKMDEEFKVQLSRKSSLLQLLKDINSTEQLQAIFTELETLQKESTQLQKSEDRLRRENVLLEKSLKEFSSLTKEELVYAQEILKGQVSYLTRRLNMGGGNELPPCWANRKSGRAEYIFTVILGEYGIRVAPRWPKYRAKELRKYGSLQKLFKRDLSVDEFLQLTKPIYRDAEKKECKHYLYMFDDALTKDGYKTKRLHLENYFYKYEDASKIFDRF
ncbi:MAG: hypothetical protein V3S80_09625 [Sulfurimonadaceae bacterium]